MPQRARGLTAAQVDKGAALGRFGDGGGLYLLVRSREAKFWLFRYTRHGKTREMGQAQRPAARQSSSPRRASRRGNCTQSSAKAAFRWPSARPRKPSETPTKRKRRPAPISFAQVTDMFLAAHERGWRIPKHRQQWRNTLRDYVLLAIGERRSATSTPARSRRSSSRSGERNPKRRRVCAGASRRSSITPRRAAARRRKPGPLARPSRSTPTRAIEGAARRHHAALDWRKIGAFMARLRRMSGMSARCLEFLILTAARSGEVRGARWSEFDLAAQAMDHFRPRA